MNNTEKPLKIVIHKVDPETKADLERVRTINGYSNFAGALKHVMSWYMAREKVKEKE